MIESVIVFVFMCLIAGIAYELGREVFTTLRPKEEESRSTCCGSCWSFTDEEGNVTIRTDRHDVAEKIARSMK